MTYEPSLEDEPVSYVSIDDMLEAGRERLGYEPGHEADCSERMTDFCLSKCSCGPKPPATHSETI